MNRYFLALLIIQILFSSCHHENHNVIQSFCFWKTNLSFDEKSDSLVNDLKLKHFYVRYFDLDWNPYRKQAQPLASIQSIYFNKTNCQFTPSIFITNDVVLNSTKVQLDTLSNRIYNRVFAISDAYFTQSASSYANQIVSENYEKQNGENKKMMDTEPIVVKRKLELKKNIQDILIDCDWSEKSKENYFYLLQKKVLFGSLYFLQSQFQ